MKAEPKPTWGEIFDELVLAAMKPRWPHVVISAPHRFYVNTPGAGAARAVKRLERQRAIWANTPAAATPPSRQRRRWAARRATA